MKIFAYAASGFSGKLVSVEVDIRRGMPGLDIVGLPDGAVRESRDRVRVALKRSGFDFPRDRILVNLAPADLRKEGASYDLPIAVGILLASGQIVDKNQGGLLCAGELMLDGAVRPVSGILPAVAASLSAGTCRFLIPSSNYNEATTLEAAEVAGISHLRELFGLFERPWPASGRAEIQENSNSSEIAAAVGGELSDLRGQPILRRALELAAAGRHHLLLFGPPGSGKTLAARAIPSILPNLDTACAVEVTRIHSQAGILHGDVGLLSRPPYREPHHSASAEGLIGGGSGSRPGEVSLAHGGVLFLDEAPEFGAKVLQSLREPLESKRVDMARAGRTWWYPADFQLQLAMNPCPCGNLGREDSACLCTAGEISRYWRRLGGALLDRVDIRVPVSPVAPEKLLEPPGESSARVLSRVIQTRSRQAVRFRAESWRFNADIPPGRINEFVPLDEFTSPLFTRAARQLGLSSRAAHGVLRVALTIADLCEHERIGSDDLLEALQHRRYGDRDLFWTTL